MRVTDSSAAEGNADRIRLMPLGDGLSVEAYPDSINKIGDVGILMARHEGDKHLFVVASKPEYGITSKFDGEVLNRESAGNAGWIAKRCPLSHHNAAAIRDLFPFTRAVPIGLRDSFGFGDRIGLANPGHLRALKGSNFKPVLAQQSIRELTRTQRTPEDVMDAAVWAVYQEGFKDGFGADADHLKTTQDVDRLVKAGYTMFTIDPSDHVVGGVGAISGAELEKRVIELPWNEFEDVQENLLRRYSDKKIELGKSISVAASAREVREACLKYMAAILNIKKIHTHLKTDHANYNCEIEVSIDETDTVTTPFEHLFIVTELNRLGVTFISLAPRFVGDFEKGVEYKGDIEIFKKDFAVHVAIADHFGFYKISFHSGSDKFRIYEAVGSMHHGHIHVKTAGTSYLEALKVTAIKEADLFREILDFAVGLYETEKKSYFVSADMKRIKPAKEYGNSELESLFTSNDVRQALHVTYSRVLTERDDKGRFIFRDRIYRCLDRNEELHYKLLMEHFGRHLEPFGKEI